MNDQKKFKHIEVSSVDDDIVIQAGILDSEKPVEVQDDASYADGIIRKDEALSASKSSEQSDADSQSFSSDENQESLASIGQTPDDSYKQTTLEDIESSKMSTMQKIIIVIAVLAIVVFAVYTFISGQ